MAAYNQLYWYTPAETSIPYSALLSAFLPSEDNFEKTISSYFQTRTCLLAGSGRSLLASLFSALYECTENKRNEVLIPGYTCYSVAAAVVRAGLRINTYDLSPHTFEPDIESLSNKLNEKTLAVVGQHLFGIPSPLEAMKEMAHKVGACFIEDAAQAFGGTLGGKDLGTIGDFGLFSFGRGKPLPLGAGGALIGQGLDKIIQKIPSYNEQGIGELIKTILIRLLSNKLSYGVIEKLPLGLGRTTFDPKFKQNVMSSFIKKLGVEIINLLEVFNAHRRMIAKHYSIFFDEKSVINTPSVSKPVYTRYPVIAGTMKLPSELIRFGVRRMYPMAIAEEPAIKPYLSEHHLSNPGAAYIARSLITLPTHMKISKDLAREIAQSVRKYYRC